MQGHKSIEVCWVSVIAWCAVVALGGAVSPACAQSVLLEWAWQPGEALTYEITEELEQESMTQAMGERTEQTLKDVRTWTAEQAVLSVTDDGVATVQREYKRLKMEHTDADGKRVEYDSDRPAEESAQHPRIRPFAAFVGKTIEFDVDREGRVLRATGGDALIRAMTDSMRGSGLGAGGGLDALVGGGGMDYNEMFRRQIEQSLRIVPGKSVRRGESWDGSTDQPVPGLGSVTVNQTHTYAGTKRVGQDSGARITTRGEMVLPDTSPLSALITLKLEQSEIEATSVVDIERGTLLESDATMLTRVSGSSSLIDDMRFEQTLRQRSTLKLISGR